MRPEIGIILLQNPQVLSKFFSVHLDGLHIQKHEQHPAGLRFVEVLPLVHAATIDA